MGEIDEMATWVSRGLQLALGCLAMAGWAELAWPGLVDSKAGRTTWVCGRLGSKASLVWYAGWASSRE